MTKIDIISGFLGAGKTTFIKKLLKEAMADEQVVLIENEFGEIGIDGGFLKEAGIEITEMNSGCICCSLVGDFEAALQKVMDEYHPDRIIIEPSGVGKLSDVIAAVRTLDNPNMELNSFVTVADVTKCKMYMKNFGEFYNNQIENAKVIVLSRTQKVDTVKLEAAVALLKEQNHDAVIITTPWDTLNGKQILDTMESQKGFLEQVLEESDICPECGHHHDHGEHDHECCGHHDHEEHDHECCGHHDHGEHDHECCGHHRHEGHDHEYCGHHHDHEAHDHECGCSRDHHGHHADDVFTSWGVETPHTYTKEALEAILKSLSESSKYGIILRAKGMVPDTEGGWLYFDMVPEEYEVRTGAPEITGRICVIGSKLDEQAIKSLFLLA
ncbi:MAG: GTP-binding protein [Erysipelotrichaceae bacterium]|nr:GTP-binding protein [Erysipelotrichaceae bacterium]